LYFWWMGSQPWFWFTGFFFIYSRISIILQVLGKRSMVHSLLNCLMIWSGLGTMIKKKMGRYCRLYKSIVLFYIFLVYPWLDPSFWEKDRWYPFTKFGCCITHFGCVTNVTRHNIPLGVYYTPKVWILRHKICVWAAPRCVWSSPDTSWSGNLTVREEKKEIVFLYSLQ
jgi:hypothetical protein